MRRLLICAFYLLCAGTCFCARARLVFVSPQWGEVVEGDATLVIQNTGFEDGDACPVVVALDQKDVYSGAMQHELIAIKAWLHPGHHQLTVRSSAQCAAHPDHPLPSALLLPLSDAVLFVVRAKSTELAAPPPPRSPPPACPQLNLSAHSSASARMCRVLHASGLCDALPGVCSDWRHDAAALHRAVDAQIAPLSQDHSGFWSAIDACIYSALMIAAHNIASAHPHLAPRAYDLALVSAASARACPAALRSGAWKSALDHDMTEYWRQNAAQSDAIFFIVVSGTSFMGQRARAVRCSWAARARNVLLISGQQQVFDDRCSEMARDLRLPPWHALRVAHAAASPLPLTSRALAHDDFFSSLPKFTLSLLLAHQLNPSAHWYFMAGCDTAVHPVALAALLSPIDPARRVLVGGHVGVTNLLRSQLFLSGGAGFALSRAALLALLPIIEDFTETWLLREGAECGCIPCADVALQRLCERVGIETVELEGFYAHPPAYYMGSSVLQKQFAAMFPWEQRLPHCQSCLRASVANQALHDMLQSMDARWGRSRAMSSPPAAFHYLAPRRMHQTWTLLQSLHMLYSKGLCYVARQQKCTPAPRPVALVSERKKDAYVALPVTAPSAAGFTLVVVILHGRSEPGAAPRTSTVVSWLRSERSATSTACTPSKPSVCAARAAAAMVLTLLGARGHRVLTLPRNTSTARSECAASSSLWLRESCSFRLCGCLAIVTHSPSKLPPSAIFLMSSAPQSAPLGMYKPWLRSHALRSVLFSAASASAVGDPTKKSANCKKRGPQAAVMEGSATSTIKSAFRDSKSAKFSRGTLAGSAASPDTRANVLFHTKTRSKADDPWPRIWRARY
jgi:hypothetical protein